MVSGWIKLVHEGFKSLASITITTNVVKSSKELKVFTAGTLGHMRTNRDLWRQTETDEDRWEQTGPDGGRRRQTGPDGARRGQTRTDGYGQRQTGMNGVVGETRADGYC